MVRLLLAVVLLSLWISVCADAAEIRIAYLRAAESKSRLSLVEIPANDDGLAGAQLAIRDNNTTGKFLNQKFSLEDKESQQGDDLADRRQVIGHESQLHLRRP